MAESMSVLVDKILQNISHVKICQDYFELLTSSLNRLRSQFNNDNHLDVLKTMEQLIINCSTNPKGLDGFNYADLCSLLFRFHWFLIEYETNTIDDYQKKLEIQSDVIEKHNALITKFSNEIEKFQSSKPQNNSLVLSDNETNTLRIYLQHLIELYKTISITDLTNEAVKKVMQDFYQIQLQESSQTYRYSRTRPIIKLKSDRSTPLERNKNLNTSWKKLISTTYMMSIVEKEYYNEENNCNDEYIIRTRRYLVILGESGCGKTNFIQWLIYSFAQNLLHNSQTSITNYGSNRIPILINLKEFAQVLKQYSSITLFDYIGQYKWINESFISNSTEMNQEYLSLILQNCIKMGQTLIILDNIDEILFDDELVLIINSIEKFVDNYCRKSIDENDPYSYKLFDDQTDFRGNQIIITSRRELSLSEKFHYCKIQPLNKTQTENLIDNWFKEIHRQLINKSTNQLTNKGTEHANAVKKQLENNKLYDITSNIGFASLICTINFNHFRDLSLPKNRIEFYDDILNSSLSNIGNIDRSKLFDILSNLALRIYECSPSNIIDQEEIEYICIQSMQSNSSRKLLRNVIDEKKTTYLAEIICHHLKFLIQKDKQSYSFINLTFQQYFTCLKLIGNYHALLDKTQNENRQNLIKQISRSLHQNINNHYFQIVIKLAFIKLSSILCQKDFDDICYEFIRQENSIEYVFPMESYKLVTFIKDFVNYPSDEVLFNVFDRLILTARKDNWSSISPDLFHQIGDALNHCRHDFASLWIDRFLLQFDSQNIENIYTLCELIQGQANNFQNIKWLSRSACSIVQTLLIHDNESNGYRIDRLLMKIAISNHELLPIKQNSLKELLINENIELNQIPLILFSLIICLYGGLKRDKKLVTFDPLYIHRESQLFTPILKSYLMEKNPIKQKRALKVLQHDCLKLFVARMRTDDESNEMIDLCIAIICFYDIEYIEDNINTISHTILYRTMNRLKYILMMLREMYFTHDAKDYTIEHGIKDLVSNSVEKLKTSEMTRMQFLDLLNSLKSAQARLRYLTKSILFDGDSKCDERMTMFLPNSLREGSNALTSLLCTDENIFSTRQSCTLLHKYKKLFWLFENSSQFNTQYRTAVMLDTIPNYLAFRYDEDILSIFTFIPEHLQNLYYRLLKTKLLIVNSDQIEDVKIGKSHMYFNQMLMECLIFVSNPSNKRLTNYVALVTLMPWLRMQKLENFGTSLVWAFSAKESDHLAGLEMKKQLPMNFETGQYLEKDDAMFESNGLTYQQITAAIKDDIRKERSRLRNARNTNDMELYSASVCTARVCSWEDDTWQTSLLHESLNGAMSITNKLVRLDALCIIAYYAPLDYNRIQLNTGRTLKDEIEYQLNNIYSNLPLLVHAAIFIRCLPLLKNQTLIDLCLENLLNKLGDTDQRDLEAVQQALLPYIKLNATFSSIIKSVQHSFPARQKTFVAKSTVMKKCFNIDNNQNLPLNLLFVNLYLAELVSDVHLCYYNDNRQFAINECLINKLLPFESSILSEAQALIITKILSLVSSSNKNVDLEKICIYLSNALHRVDFVELKAANLVKSWLSFKNSKDLALFAWHAAILLANSDFWSVEAADILCDLLICENDRFRQRIHMIFQQSNDDADDLRTSSKLGFQVILILIKKRAYFRINSASISFQMARMFQNVTLDNQSHLENLLWLERYRIHSLMNRNFSLSGVKISTHPYVASFFSNNNELEAVWCANIFQLSGDLVIYMCDLIQENFFQFVEINGDSTSVEVLESHKQFVIIVISTLYKLLNKSDYTRHLAFEALSTLFDTVDNNEIRRVVALGLGYTADETNYKNILEKILSVVNHSTDEEFDQTNLVLSALVSSYFYRLSLNDINTDAYDMEVFCQLLQSSSNQVITAIQIGFGRILTDPSLLNGLVGCNFIQSYHALIGSTAYALLYDIQGTKEISVANLIEQHPSVLSIFMTELLNFIGHFTNEVSIIQDPAYSLSYAYPSYVTVASLIAVKVPEAFCAYINHWPDGNKLKRALFYTAKQHNYPQRGACLTILLVLGELNSELCELMINAVYDDAYIQNRAYECINRLNSIKDEKTVFNLLSSYLKSKSMNVRHMSAKILFHLSKIGLVPLKVILPLIQNVINDPDSNEELWLIEEQNGLIQKLIYNYAGRLKDVIYSLLLQQLADNVKANMHFCHLNDIDFNFTESEKASRFSLCRYENQN